MPMRALKTRRAILKCFRIGVIIMREARHGANDASSYVLYSLKAIDLVLRNSIK